MNWDDLRILAAIGETGTYAGASKRLGLDETTVARRLQRLEATLGVKLLDPVDGIRRPTPACDAVLRHVGAMVRHVDGISRLKRDAAADGVTGKIRIATTNALAEEILAPRLAELLQQHPGLTVHLLTSTQTVNFSRWEADLAIRLRKPERGDYTIARLAAIPLYCLEPARPDGSDPPLVCAYPSDHDDTPESRFLARRDLQATARCITASGRVIRAMVLSRRAVGILPSYLCRDLLGDPALRSTLLPQSREVWLLIQRHLRRDPTARAVIDWLRSCFTA